MADENVVISTEENGTVESTPQATEAVSEVAPESEVAPVSESGDNKDEKKDTIDPQNHQEMLVNMEIKTQNDALNCIIGYIGLAQRRGVFALDESAKLFECIKMFRGN